MQLDLVPSQIVKLILLDVHVLSKLCKANYVEVAKVKRLVFRNYYS